MAKTAFAKDHLQSFINRIERLNEEREALSADIREVFAEAKGTGFDVKIMRQVIRMRKLDKADFQEQEAMLDLYLTAMDMRDGAPLLDYSDRVAEQNAPRPSNRDVSADGEPSSEAGPQAQASQAGTGSEMLAGHEGHSSDGAAVAAEIFTQGRGPAAPMEIPAFLLRAKPPPEPVPA